MGLTGESNSFDVSVRKSLVKGCGCIYYRAENLHSAHESYVCVSGNLDEELSEAAMGSCRFKDATESVSSAELMSV